MDLRNVMIIIDVNRFTREDVEKELKAEGYKHNFFFANFNSITDTMAQLEVADEVWLWGDCKDNVYYKKARKIGADIWQMKL